MIIRFDIDFSEVTTRLAELEANGAETAAFCAATKSTADATLLKLTEIERRARASADETSARMKATLELESNHATRLKVVQKRLRHLDRTIRWTQRLARLGQFWTQLGGRKDRGDGPN
jgi:hypothetical protein